MTAAAERTAGLMELHDRLRFLLMSGFPVPCRQARSHRAWISDDPAEQVAAALLCRGCAAQSDCDAYGLAHLGEFGVYGGRTDSERHPGRLAREQATARRAEQAQRRPCVLTPDVLAAVHASASEAAARTWPSFLASLSPETFAHIKAHNRERRADYCAAPQQVVVAAVVGAGCRERLGRATQAPIEGASRLMNGASR